MLENDLLMDKDAFPPLELCSYVIYYQELTSLDPF